MKGSPTDFWGKLVRMPETENVVEWHPLIDHCADVSACAAGLIELPTWGSRLARLYGVQQLDAATKARLSVLAALHDIGKFNLGFQAKGRPELGQPAGHVREALGAIGSESLAAIEPLGDWGIGTTGLLVSSICHHGRPYAYNSPHPFQQTWWRSRAGLDPRNGVEALVAACRTWYPDAFSADAPSLDERPDFEHAFAGLIMLSDWIGSDSEFFPYADDRVDRMPFARAAAADFMSNGWLDATTARRSDRAKCAAFQRVSSHHTAKPTQTAITRLPSDEDSSITVLESETGSGKTEAALARFITLFSAGKVDGLYFALPTRTAATQMHRRVFNAVQLAFSDPPPVVLGVPDYLRVDDREGEKSKLARFDVLWPDADRFRYRGWAGEGPKRYLAGCVIVGTIDQVLLSSLRVNHAHMRATALMRLLLVVDEVHASDAYMTRILEDVLARHRRAGGHALLLSATLGGEVRARLLAPGERPSLPSLDAATETAYPLISHRGSDRRHTLVPCEAKSRDVTVEDRPLIEDHSAVAALALAGALAGAKVLVVKNTVLDCIETQRAIERLAAHQNVTGVLFHCRGAIAPHHARFSRGDREALDTSLEGRFGKERDADGCVLIATQTVQQSLDIDADLLLTDLCPADVLLQRIGRLHRHARARPAGFEVARAIVLTPSNRDLGVLLGPKGKARHHHGLGTVYPDLRVLEATWQVIEAAVTWSIPSMNRSIVERSVHSSALEAISASLKGDWEAHGQYIRGTERGESRQADLNLIEWSTAYSETTFAEHVHIPTRLGEGDRRVCFEVPFTGPFGLPVTELTLRATWASGVPADEYLATAVVSRDGMVRFQFGDRKFVYDRHGLRRAGDDRDDVADDGP